MEERTSTARVALKYGVLAAVVAMVYSTILNVSGLGQNTWLTAISYIFMIVAIFLGIKEFREKNQGFISYGEGLGLGSLLSAVLGVLSAAFTLFYIRFIDDSVLTQGLDRLREDMERQGKDDVQIEQALEVSQKLMSPGLMFVSVIIVTLIAGFVISLIAAAIMRREKPVFE